MKTLSLFLFALLLGVSSFGRVRSVSPEYGYKVLNSVTVDSVLIVRFLVHFDGVSRIVVVREDCNCVVTSINLHLA